LHGTVAKGTLRQDDGEFVLKPTPHQNPVLAKVLGGFATLTAGLDYAARGVTGFNFYSSRGALEHVLPYRELRLRAIATARKLLTTGLKRGDRVAIVAETSPEFMAVFFGCQYAGLVPCPMPYSMYIGGKDAYVERGFIHVPASGSHGGVIASGGIRRDAVLSLAALRLLGAGKDEKKTLALRRYVLGLALTALTKPPTVYLRQGCNLVIDPDKTREFMEVHADGKRTPAMVTHDGAISFAASAANAFGLGESRTVQFDTNLAKQDVSGDAADTAKAGKKSAKKSK